MKNKLLAPGSIALAMLLTGCDQAAPPTERGAAVNTVAAAEEVRRTEQEMLAAFQAKDAAKLSSYYAPDALVATPGRPALKGAEAISKAMGEDFSDPNFKLSFTNENTEVAGSGDIAYAHGSFAVTYTNQQTKQAENGAGTYVTVFKKQADGAWKVVADVATSSG